jgi:hypothetical protein
MQPARSLTPIILMLLLCACHHSYTPKICLLVINGTAEQVQGAVVTSDFFSNAKVRPYLGRFFSTAASQRSLLPEVVLSYGIWERVFHHRPEIVGSSIELDHHPALVVGVAQPGFAAPEAGEVWMLRRTEP